MDYEEMNYQSYSRDRQLEASYAFPALMRGLVCFSCIDEENISLDVNGVGYHRTYCICCGYQCSNQ